MKHLLALILLLALTGCHPRYWGEPNCYDNPYHHHHHHHREHR